MTGGSPRFLRRPGVRAFFSAPTGVFGLVVILVLVVVAIVGPEVFHDKAEAVDPANAFKGASADHLLGTDQLGRDVLYRLLVATRMSLLMGLTATGIGLSLGVALGVGAALMPGRVRPFLLRFIDAMLSFPAILTAIVVSTIVGVGLQGALLGVGIATSFAFARLSSTLALSIAGRDYVDAARVVGVKRFRRMRRYILPNVAEPLIIGGSVAASYSIIAISALSFLGIGVQSPDYDWGQLLTEGVRSIYLTPAAALGPTVAIALTALAFGFVGEALARALNPLLWSGDRRRRRGGRGDVPAQSSDGQGPVPADAALEVHDLVVSFPGADGPVEVVKGVSFTTRRGQMLGIVGESGSGKTMTALAIAQLTPFPGRVTGTVRLHGQDVMRLSRSELSKLYARELAVVFQDPSAALNPAARIGTQMTFGVRIHRKLRRRAAWKLAGERLRETHIPAAERQLHRYPHELSGGMRQRVMIAMGLMSEPSLLIADEPTTALDVTVQAQIMQLLEEVHGARDTAVILISHNLALVSQSCHRVIVMYAGRIVEELDTEQLRTDPLHPYTRALLASVPEIGHRRGEPLGYIPGEMPNLADPPAGCPFHPRCPLAVDRCRTDLPRLLTRPEELDRRVACHVANDTVAA
jgi:peptide/nickel transport system permease protein